MTRLSVDEAQAIVDDIRVTNGGLSPEAERGLSQEAKRALRNLQSIAGGSIVHVAQDLYDKDTRFIYEMIQNAEDNRYTRALKDKKEPFLHFTLYDDRITVDSNEDGFSESDVRAICSIHQSSKKQTSGYIGHKGIGFKSVFKIAPKVTIQSASFCFFFRHTQGDSGMGMITPYNESHEALPAAVTTRITLDLKSPTDFEARAREFEDVPDTLLLFLRQLRNLTLDVVPRGSKTVYKRLEPSRHRVKLVKQIGYNEHYNHYVFKKKTLTGLPQHSSRPGSDEAEVILAFPVDEDSCPLIQPQYVYSFLPMRHEGFNFLIQSDFITQANRLGVHLCPRNEAIRQGICNLFVRTVLGMSAADSELRFEWLQYLPGPHIYDPFWSELREMIFDKLKISKVLLSGEGRLDYPDDLRHLQPFHCLPTGAPVFDDITPELYLSGGYNWTRDEDRLRQLGASNLTYDEALDRLEPYLDGPFPRLLHLDMLPLWHTRVAKLLLRALRKEGRSSRIVKRIKRLPLVPTVRLSLVSPISHSVYFPADEEGNAIPDDLNNLRIVQSSALECPHRRELIETLGVNHCKPNKVARSILKRYNHRHDSITLRNSVDHLRYLFKTMEHDEDLDKRIFIMNEHEQRIYRVFVTLGVDIVIDDVYFETMGEYGTRAICDKLKSSSDSVNDESQYDMHILHEDYIESVPAGIIVHGRTWEQWLEEVAQVRRVPRLKHRRGDNMSQLSKHLADHDPVTLLGMLKTYIKAYIQELTPGVIQGLRTMSVPCQNDYTQDLEATYFPSRELTGLCSTATLDTVFDGFLDIPPRLVTDDVRGWEFLAELGVTLEPEIIFFSDLLSLLLDKHTGGEDTENAYFGIYKELFFRFPNMDELLEGIFEDGFRAVYVPGGILARAEVVELEECVWNGDPCLRRTVPLATYTEYANSPHAVGLFRDRLLLPDADIQTYIRELHWYKDNTDVSKDDIPEIYRAISEQLDTPEDCDLVLAEFTSSSLLFISETQEWVVPASCVWTDAAKLGTKYGLKNEYPELEDFFCDALSIPAPNATNYIEELKELITHHPVDLAHIKEIFTRLNTLIPSAEEVRGLHDLEFLPVRSPDSGVRLLRVADTFFIADRIEYTRLFQGKVPTLDFSLKECHRYRPLLRSLGLNDRYMSVAVQEETFVDQPSQEHSPRLTRQFRRRAHAIYRCILHYKDDEPVDTLHRLLGATLHESDGFKRSLLLQLNDVRAEVQSNSGSVHIEEVDDRLQIYIPRTPEERQRCYSLHLPKALQHHFRVRAAEAQFTFPLVFLSSEALIDQVLDSCGIVGIPEDIPQQPFQRPGEEGDSYDESSIGESDTDTRVYTPASSPAHGGSPEETPTIPHYNGASPRARRFSSIRYARTPEPRPITIFHEQPPPYVRLLENVTSTARQHTLAEFLQNHPNHTTSIADVAHESAFGPRSQKQLEHDIKIGAAGELFVFELLLAENLPNFTRANWQSTIRKHVSVHPDYQDMRPWNGVETADIVYPDTSSSVTSILVDAGYLDEEWAGTHPTYYVEVKTTTGECDGAFFMSRAQYMRMGRMHLQHPDQANFDIYLIFRVHHLGKRNMGVQLYVDPEGMRQEGSLVFRSESYSVRPGAPTQ